MVRASAAESLGCIGDSRAVEPLFRALGEGSPLETLVFRPKCLECQSQLEATFDTEEMALSPVRKLISCSNCNEEYEATINDELLILSRISVPIGKMVRVKEEFKPPERKVTSQQKPALVEDVSQALRKLEVLHPDEVKKARAAHSKGHVKNRDGK